MLETWVWSPGWKDPLEKEMATHSSTLAWKIPRTEKPGRLQSMGSQRVGHDWATSLSLSDKPEENRLRSLETDLLIYKQLIYYQGSTADLWGVTCLLRNLYAGQEATVRTGHVTTDWFQIGKGVRQGCILSPCLFNLYAEYIMRNAGLEEAQAGIRLLGEISITSDMQMAPPLWQKVKRN